MIVMGGIIGSGIFVNPAAVARHVGTPMLIVGAWLIGGAIALIGALVYAELAARRPETGGQYAYLRDAWGPIPAFLYGWSLLLVIQSGGMAAVAITFARYFVELTEVAVAEGAIAAAALALLTAVNCFGVRAGSNVQSALMVLKIAILAALVMAGFLFAPAATPSPVPTADVAPLGLLAAPDPHGPVPRRRPDVVRAERQSHDRERDIAPVPHEHDESGVRPDREQLVDVMEIGRGLVAPAALAGQARIGAERRLDGEPVGICVREAGRHRGRFPGQAPAAHSGVLPDPFKQARSLGNIAQVA
jgi:hypothetical protein